MNAPPKHWLLAGLPLWLYIIFFKSGASLYYTFLSPLGERVLPIWMVGLLIGASSFLQLILDVPAGFLLDTYGYKPLLRFASFTLALGGILLIVFGLNLWIYLVLIVLSGFGWLFFGPGVDAYLLSTAPKALVGRYMGMRRSASSLGMVIAVACFTLLVSQSDRAIGGMITLGLGISFLIAHFLKEKPASVHKEIKIETHHYYIRRTYLKEALLAVKKLNPASAMLAFSGFSGAAFYGMIWLVLPLYLKGLAHPGPLSFGLSIFDVTTIVCGGIVGRIADTKRKTLMIFLGLLLFATCATLLGFHLNGWFLVLGFLASMGDELSSVSLWAWMNRLNRDHAHDGLIAAVVTFFEDLGWVVGPIMGGFFYAFLGVTWTMVLGSSFLFLNWFVSSLLLHRSGYPIFHTTQPPSVKPHRYSHKD